MQLFFFFRLELVIGFRAWMALSDCTCFDVELLSCHIPKMILQVNGCALAIHMAISYLDVNI